MEEAVLLSAERAPVRRCAGILKAEAVPGTKSGPGSIEQVILGVTNQSGEDILEGTYTTRRPRVVPERSL